MAPEHEARPRADFYDHESEEPRRRRHPVADWGVGEDIFDRLPSRRFTRADRRAEHHEIVVRRGREEDGAESCEEAIRGADDWADEAAWGESAERESGFAGESAAEPRRDDVPWSEDADVSGHLMRAPAVDSWMDDAERRLVPGESRTIVLGADEAPQPPEPRRTVKISGHPDRLPVAPRPQRPPRTAVERIGASPDRIVAYAVALGFLLVLIAVLTTGQ